MGKAGPSRIARRLWITLPSYQRPFSLSCCDWSWDKLCLKPSLSFPLSCPLLSDVGEEVEVEPQGKTWRNST